jgi:hypothetical protein
MAIITKPPAAIAKRAVTVRMPEPIAETLHQYAKFLDSSLDHIVVEALKLIFRKDTEFKLWQDQQQTSVPQVVVQTESTSAAPPPLFAESKRDGRRATGREGRER